MLIVYRACPIGNPKDKVIEDKYELVKLCFNSLREAFFGIEYDLVVLLDKPDVRFRKLFDGYYVVESYFGGLSEGNIRSFHKQIELALDYKDRYLFVEDDYYFFDNAGEIISQLDFDFFTPYDHPRYYGGAEHNYKRDLELKGGHHWQTVNSTTLTFGGSYEALEKEAETIKGYGWADGPMWEDITQRHRLHAPIPTLATHMETKWLAPNVDYPFLQTS